MSEKIDEEIQNLIKRGNFKQCNEKITYLKKQFPKSSYLNILEIYVKYMQSPSKFNYESSLGNLYGLNGSEITSDVRALNLLHKFFIQLERYDEALHVYERANFKYQGYDVALQWFEKALEDSNWKQMARASQQLAKTSGNNDNVLSSRDYFFWYALSILSLFKFQSYRVSEKEKMLLPQLAYRSLSSNKPFRSTQEINIFCSVCAELFPNDAEKSKEIVQEIIPHLGNSVDLYLKNFLVQHIQANDHKTMFEACCTALKKIDDFELIVHLISSGKELNKTKLEINKQIELLVEDSRNSRLARLESDYLFDRRISHESLLHYLSKFHNKPCCPVDLLRYEGKLDKEILKSALYQFSSADVIHDSNVFELALLEHDPIKAYNKHKESLKSKPKTDYSTCSVFILDIVKSIVVTSDKPSLEKVLLALTLLENYQAHDTYNYHTKAWIIALYMHLGCVPLAYSRYSELKVKNVQIDTTSFLLYSRFSTLYPQKQHDYLQNNNEKLYGSSMARLPQFIHIALERKAYSKILGMIEFRERLQKSSTKWMLTTEAMQLARLCNDKRGELLKNAHEDWRIMENTGSLEFSDNRDWTIFGSDISKDKLPHVLQYLDLNEKSIALRCIREFIIELIPLRQTNDKLDTYLEDIVGEIGLEETLHSSCDKTDVWAFKVFYDLYKHDGAHLKQLLDQMNAGTQSHSTWKLSDDYLTKMSTLKTLDTFKRIKDPNVKQSIKTNINRLRDVCDDLFHQYSLELTVACENLTKGESGELLKNLGYIPISASTLKDCLQTVQKTVRNL